MTSERKIAANRRNSQKSCGPRSAAGKAIASRNALRHGLAATLHMRPERSSELERLARAICGDDNDPLLLEQALVIAANERMLRSIDAQRTAVIERLRDIKSIALAKGDNSLALAKASFQHMQQNPRYNEEYDALMDRLSRPRTEPDPDPDQEWVPDFDAARKLYKERDECEALEKAAPDLVRLERYHRRTWSRQRRAIRAFANMKLIRSPSAAQPAPGLRDETMLLSRIETLSDVMATYRDEPS
jgi:hypothetical protein